MHARHPPPPCHVPALPPQRSKCIDSRTDVSFTHPHWKSLPGNFGGASTPEETCLTVTVVSHRVVCHKRALLCSHLHGFFYFFFPPSSIEWINQHLTSAAGGRQLDFGMKAATAKGRDHQIIGLLRKLTSHPPSNGDSGQTWFHLYGIRLYSRPHLTFMMQAAVNRTRVIWKSGQRRRTHRIWPPAYGRGLAVPAEPEAACAWVDPSDMTHLSFIAGELCPSSSPSPQHT